MDEQLVLPLDEPDVGSQERWHEWLTSPVNQHEVATGNHLPERPV
jgi:hypothetical protein